jgi:hypothetical protein
MACQLNLSGNIIVGGQGCGCEGGNTKVQGLSFACPYTTFQAVASTDCAVAIATPGAPGDSFVELPTSDAIGSFLLLALKSSAPVVLRIGAGEAVLLGSGGIFPTGFAGGELFAFVVDSVAVNVTFQSGDQSASQVAVRVNQAAVAAGLSFLPMTLQTNGQLKIAGQKTGVAGFVDIVTANAAIGFPSAAAYVEGGGKDQRVSGLLLQQFDPSVPPARIQISGTAQIEVLAAGTAPV